MREHCKISLIISEDTIQTIFEYLTLRDLLRLSIVHSMCAKVAKRVINMTPWHNLLHESHRFISTRNWKAAVIFIDKHTRSIWQDIYFGVLRDKRTTVCIKLDLTGNLFVLPVYCDDSISSDPWISIGTVTQLLSQYQSLTQAGVLAEIA